MRVIYAMIDAERAAPRYGKEAARQTRQALAGRRSGDVSTADTTSLDWPTRRELHLAARSHWAFVLGERIADLARAAADFVRALRVRYRRHHRIASLKGSLRRDGG